MVKNIGKSGTLAAGAVVSVAAIAAFAFGPQAFSTSNAQAIAVEAPRGAPISFADLIEQVSPAVVSVNVVSEREIGGVGELEEFFERFRGAPGLEEFLERRREERGDEEPRTREARSLGSGFFISADGLIVTNNHVVQGATEIEVVLEDGRELEAELVGTDRQTDLAVLRVTEPGTFPHVEFSTEARLRKGDWVVALGNPFGLGGTATAGIVSAFGRELGPDSPYTDFLQIDASINRGNSGGPTFDLKGRVIGVNTAIFSPTGGSVGIGFAIPADLAIQVTEQLIENGRVSRGWLGVSIQDLTDDMAEAQGLSSSDGAIVAELVEGSPALKAGIRRGDIVVELNGAKIADATGLTRAVGSLLVGSENRFIVLRDGQRRTINVTVAERPDDPLSLPTSDDATQSLEGELADSSLGVSLAPLDDETRQSLGLKIDEPGVVIAELLSTSPLYDAGLRQGMAILEVNGQSVNSADAFENAVEAAKDAGREKVLIAVRAGTVTGFRTLDLAESE
ncbi:MAG: Do family serine endopeptidase [Pseudomonadota bacterium]